MLPVTATNPDMQGVAKQAGTEYVKGFAKEGGKNTADYVAENGDEHISDAQRQVDDAKAQAQVGGVHVALSPLGSDWSCHSWVFIYYYRACGQNIVAASQELE